MSLIRRIESTPKIKSSSSEWINIDLSKKKTKYKYDPSSRLITDIFESVLRDLGVQLAIEKFGFQIALYNIDISSIDLDALFSEDLYTKEVYFGTQGFSR